MWLWPWHNCSWNRCSGKVADCDPLSPLEVPSVFYAAPQIMQFKFSCKSCVFNKDILPLGTLNGIKVVFHAFPKLNKPMLLIIENLPLQKAYIIGNSCQICSSSCFMKILVDAYLPEQRRINLLHHLHISLSIISIKTVTEESLNKIKFYIGWLLNCNCIHGISLIICFNHIHLSHIS